MIRMVTQEYQEGNLAVRTTVVTFLFIPIFKFKKTSTNQMAVGQLAPIRRIQLKGFSCETENKSKGVS